MEEYKSYITQEKIRIFYKQQCKEEGRKFTESEFIQFLKCCERDFYQWLNDNIKYFETEELPKE